MKLLVKYVKEEENTFLFNINLINNSDNFGKLAKTIKKVKKHYKTNLSRSNNYPDNIYLNIYKTDNLKQILKNIKQGSKFNCELCQSKKVNEKNYLNFYLTNMVLKKEEDDYQPGLINYLEI